MPNRPRVLDLTHPLGQFANELRRLQREAMGRAQSPDDVDKLQVEKIAGPQTASRATIYAALSGRRLPSPRTLLVMVMAWDPRGTEAFEAWLTFRNDVETFVSSTPTAEEKAARGDTVSSRNLPVPRASQPPQGPVAELSRALRELRDNAGRPKFWEISRQAGVSEATVSRALRGDRMPSRETIQAIASALHADQETTERLTAAWTVAQLNTRAALAQRAIDRGLAET
ncbi:helix-turn-helix domain-containing protein [Streptomyces sp. NPDC015408]|uniref:helix-turn-helix domain-containing protein n=1 Tax=Streptomyces sp. NPDC015408 TaxID=3364956 RepID=UPI0036FD7145